MGIANFILVMSNAKFVFTLPIIFLLQFLFLFSCTCGIFTENGTRRGTDIQNFEAQKRFCTRCHFYFVILLGSALWILNINLIIDSIDEGARAQSVTRKEAAETADIFSDVFAPILIVSYILDIFITIKITENYKILCTGTLPFCLDKGIKEDA